MHAKIIDLTHSLTETVPTWNGSCGFLPAIKLDYDQRCRVQNIKMHAGVGTHIDAPAHFIPGGRDVSELPLEHLLVPLYVIDVSHRVNDNASYQLQPDDIIQYEKVHGIIVPKSFVAICTGWSERWPYPDQYRNVDQQGNMHFPSIAPQAAELLIERAIVGVGIDTLSPDCSQEQFPVHEKILGSDKYIVENIAHLDKVDTTGYVACILPLKGKGLVEAPVRMIAWKDI